MLKEKADHFAAGIRAAWIGVRSIRAATRPCVPRALQDPVLERRSSYVVGVDRADVADAACGPAANNGGLEAGRRRGLGNDLVAIHGMDGLVTATVKDNGRNCRSGHGS